MKAERLAQLLMRYPEATIWISLNNSVMCERYVTLLYKDNGAGDESIHIIDSNFAAEILAGNDTGDFKEIKL